MTMIQETIRIYNKLQAWWDKLFKVKKRGIQITKHHKMIHYPVLEYIISLDKKFEEKVRKFPIPEKICRTKIVKSQMIQFQHILQAWDAKADFPSIVAKSFGLNPDRIDKYPMIDFLRLSYELADVSKKAAEMFEGLKREAPEGLKLKLDKLSPKFRSSILTTVMIASEGAYNQEQVAKLSWVFVYDILESQVHESDRAKITSEYYDK